MTQAGGVGEGLRLAPDNYPVLLGNKLLFWGNSEQVCQVHRNPKGVLGENALSKTPAWLFKRVIRSLKKIELQRKQFILQGPSHNVSSLQAICGIPRSRIVVEKQFPLPVIMHAIK